MISSLADHEFVSRGLLRMLVASRDPFHPGAHDAPHSAHDGVAAPHGGGRAPRLARAMTALQIVGTLLAIPVGIGSGYSMYRANFTVEATCQSLRGNIVTMLDRNVDAGTRHVLVRRDVEAFERTCRTIDPDATAAFHALLTAEKAAVPPATPVARQVDARPEPVAQKTERHSAVAVKRPAPPAADAAPAQRDASSDAIWVAAVRRALQSHAAEPAPLAEPARPMAVMSTAPAAAPATSRDIHPMREGRAQPMTLAPPAAVSAPALPPVMSVAIVPAPQAQTQIHTDADHPVPPASIPEMTSAPKQPGARSRLGELVAQIPFLGNALDAIDGGAR